MPLRVTRVTRSNNTGKICVGSKLKYGLDSRIFSTIIPGIPRETCKTFSKGMGILCDLKVEQNFLPLPGKLKEVWSTAHMRVAEIFHLLRLWTPRGPKTSKAPIKLHSAGSVHGRPLYNRTTLSARK